jgi:hypothetical protein
LHPASYELKNNPRSPNRERLARIDNESQLGKSVPDGEEHIW